MATRKTTGRDLRFGRRGSSSRRLRARSRPVQHEKIEQAAIVSQAKWLGGWAYVIGTRRPRGQECPNCGVFVQEWQGTCQTAGIADLLLFLPEPGGRRVSPALPLAEVLAALETTPHRFVVFECKAGDNDLQPAQRIFRALCRAAGLRHLTGDVNVFMHWCVEQGYLKASQLPHDRQPTGASRWAND